MHDLIHHTRRDGTHYPVEECCIYQAFREGKSTHVDDEVFWRADGTSFDSAYKSFPIFLEEKAVGSVVSFIDITERRHLEKKLKLFNETLGQQVIERTDKLEKANSELQKEIVERKKAEKSLKESEEYLAKAQTIAHLGHWKLDPETNEVTGSDELFRIFGLSQQESTLESFIEIVHPDDRELDVATIKRGIEFGESWNIEHRLICKDGTRKWVRAIGEAIIDKTGKTILLVGTIQEITEQKRMEKALVQTEKLSSIGTITAGVAHEFNNILAVISGKTQLLSMDYEDNKELTDELNIILQAATDGARISSRMLKFTKTEKDITDFETHDIRDLIKQSIDFTMPRWKNESQSKGINYHMVIDNIREVPAILCNPTEIREVFINLITNALDAMPDGGSISFSTWNDDNTVFVSVSDTGIGTPEDVKKSIFDPFFTTKRPIGTGLGMSTTYGIMAEHGGRIELESEIGKGSTFTLQLPVAPRLTSPKESPVLEQEIKCRNLNILVVDDEKPICDMLDSALSKQGHNVKTVNNGADAIGLIRSDEYDLVLTDLAMPDVSGHDVLKAANELEKRPKIGIITGWGEKLKLLDEEKKKIDFTLKKPFKLSEISKLINDLFSTVIRG